MVEYVEAESASLSFATLHELALSLPPEKGNWAILE